MRKVIIMSGVPGSGKSTVAKQTLETFKTNYHSLGLGAIFSADDEMMENGVYVFKPEKLPNAHKKCFRKFTDNAYYGASMVGPVCLIVDNTNLNAWEISPYVAVAQAFDFEVEIHRVSCDATLAFKRQTHNVPEAQHKRMVKNFERRDVLPWWKVTEINTN